MAFHSARNSTLISAAKIDVVRSRPLYRILYAISVQDGATRDCVGGLN